MPKASSQTALEAAPLPVLFSGVGLGLSKLHLNRKSLRSAHPEPPFRGCCGAAEKAA